MMGSRRAIGYLVLLFLLGLGLGVLGTLWAHKSDWFHDRWRHSHFSTQGAVDWLNRELTLSPDQQKQLETILDETAAGYRAIRERVQPEYEQVRHAGRDKIRAILTEAQRAKFEELVRRIDEKRQKRRQEHQERSR